MKKLKNLYNYYTHEISNNKMTGFDYTNDTKLNKIYYYKGKVIKASSTKEFWKKVKLIGFL